MTTVSTSSISWEPGQELEPLTLPPVERLQLIKYAGASGDFNPIHTVDAFAAEIGLPGIIQHGMLTMAEMARPFSPYLDRGMIQHFETRFSGMVMLGDVLTISPRVSSHETTEAGDAYKFDVPATNQKGETVAKGKVTFLVRRP